MSTLDLQSRMEQTSGRMYPVSFCVPKMVSTILDRAKVPHVSALIRRHVHAEAYVLFLHAQAHGCTAHVICTCTLPTCTCSCRCRCGCKRLNVDVSSCVYMYVDRYMLM